MKCLARCSLFLLVTVCLMAPLAVHASDDPLQEALKLDRQGFVEEAIPLWKQFLATTPEKQSHIFSQIKLCHALFSGGQLREAVESAQNLAQKYPDSFEAQFNLGNQSSALKRFPKAVKAYEAALAINPKEGLGYVGLGLSLFGGQDTERSVTVLRKARTLFKKQKNIAWYQNVRIMIGQMKSFAPYPPDFSDLWLTNNLKLIHDTYRETLFRQFAEDLNL